MTTRYFRRCNTHCHDEHVMCGVIDVPGELPQACWHPHMLDYDGVESLLDFDGQLCTTRSPSSGIVPKGEGTIFIGSDPMSAPSRLLPIFFQAFNHILRSSGPVESDEVHPRPLFVGAGGLGELSD